MEINELAKALSKFQSVLKGAEKNSKNPFFGSQYADLTSCWGAIRGPLTDNGLSVVQHCISEEDKIGIRTMLLHTSGQYIEDKFFFTPQKKGAQDMGSLISYMRRYSLKAVVGLADKDDDAEGAMSRGDKYKTPRSKTKKQQEVVKIIDLTNRLTEGQTKEQIKQFADKHIKPGLATMHHLEQYPLGDLVDIREHLEQLLETKV